MSQSSSSLPSSYGGVATRSRATCGVDSASLEYWAETSKETEREKETPRQRRRVEGRRKRKQGRRCPAPSSSDFEVNRRPGPSHRRKRKSFGRQRSEEGHEGGFTPSPLKVMSEMEVDKTVLSSDYFEKEWNEMTNNRVSVVQLRKKVRKGVFRSFTCEVLASGSMLAYNAEDPWKVLKDNFSNPGWFTKVKLDFGLSGVYLREWRTEERGRIMKVIAKFTRAIRPIPRILKIINVALRVPEGEDGKEVAWVTDAHVRMISKYTAPWVQVEQLLAPLTCGPPRMTYKSIWLFQEGSLSTLVAHERNDPKITEISVQQSTTADHVTKLALAYSTCEDAENYLRAYWGSYLRKPTFLNMLKNHFQKITVRKVPALLTDFQPGMRAIPPTVQAMMDEGRALYVYGPCGIGKSTWVHAMFPNALIVTEREDFRAFKPTLHEAIIFDEFRADSLEPDQMFSFLSVSTERSMRILNESIKLPANMPRIVTTSIPPEEFCANVLAIWEKTMKGPRRRLRLGAAEGEDNASQGRAYSKSAIYETEAVMRRIVSLGVSENILMNAPDETVEVHVDARSGNETVHKQQ